ncbi:hypothetical protein Bpfe_013071 [Biomphalaria pfeifferi]|uniref:Uncharacterized protein n=1 Tax=Biomphalaria pfeifferi TaxID=112525 RepID=A0AAD8BN09_BIOPF|nr:hypothetical protein Bpfe_013071 [Biomphalaria pfeifferi]
MDARGDQLKCHLDLGAEDKGHFTNAKQEFEQGSVGVEDYGCKKNYCEINESRATGEDHVTPQRTSEEPSRNDCSCTQEEDGVVRLPSPTNKTGQTDAEHRENETEEDSIGEDIQARFRAEQNTYFIPIKSDSQLMHAAWGPVQEDSAVATGRHHDSSVVAESSGIPCCCRHTEFLLEETPGPSVENLQLDAVPLEEPQHITVLKSCSQENSAMCNSGEVVDKARSESYAEVTANYISELKKMAENIEHILDEQNLRGLVYMATTGYDENNCSSRQSEQFITVAEEEKSRNSAHEIYNKYESHDKQLYTSITCGDSNKLNILFSSLYHKVSKLSYLETGATANTNNSGNSSSSNPVTIRDRETRPSPKIAREGVIIYEKDPNQKKTQADLVIFEGDHMISIPKEAIMANTWRDYYTPHNINSSETETMSSNYSVNQTSINDQDLGGKNAKEAMQQSPRYFVPQQCSTTASKSVNVQNLSSRTRKINEYKARRYVPITRVCARLGKLSGTSINNDNERPASPKTRHHSPKSPTYIKTSPKTRSPSPRLPKSKSPKLSKCKTLSPKSPKSKAISPKSKSKNYGSKFNHKNFSPKSRSSSPKSQNSSLKLSLSRAVSLKPRSSSSSRSSRPKTRVPKPFSAKSRSSSPKSCISRSFSPKFKKIRSPSLKSPKTRASSKLKVSNNQEKVLRESSPGQHDHIGAQYILQPPGITFKGKKTISWTDVNKLPTKKSPVSKKMKKPQGKASAKKKIKPDSAFPLSLHTYHDPLALSSYVPDMTRQLTIESPKENLMIHTTYIRPNPLHLNSKGIFELISQKRRLYLEDKEKVLSSDETRQLICETECFVKKDPKTKRLVITNGTLNELVQKTVTRSTTKLNANGRSMSKSKSETNNVQQLTNLKATKLPFQHVEMIGDYVYIGNHKPKSLSQVKDADGNENSNAHGCNNFLCCSPIVDQLETNNGYICQRNCFNTGFVSYIQTNSLPDKSVTNFSEFNIVLKMISDPVNLHFDLLSNRNNNSADGTSEMEDATLGDVDQIITEHPQLSSVKQRQGRRSRPNSPSKRSLKGKCPECEPNMPGDAEDKHFLDFEHQAHPNEINESNEVQTGSSLELRTSLLPPRNKEIKMGHKLWNTCACESPRPYVPPTYAECAIQLNLDDICGSEASQTGEEKTYTGHVLNIDHITMCECQLRMRKTQKHNFDMQVHPEDICPSNNVQTGSSLLLLEPIIKRSTEAANTSEKIGHAFKFDNSDSEQPQKFPESEIVETCEVEIQVAATDINPSIDAQPGDSLMLMEPFPPIKPTFSEDEYPEEDATWGDLSINDMISENKSVYAYYKRYEELTKLEKDYEIHARPYTTVDQLQQKSMTDSKIDPRNAGNKRSTAFLKHTPSQEYRQYATASYVEPKGTRDHEKGEFRHVAKAKESITVTNYQKESTSDPQVRGPFQGKYKNFTSSGINLPSPVGSSIESQEGERKEGEEEGENQGHRPYRRKRKPNSGPSVETQTFKSMQPNPPADQPDENPF